MRKDGHTLAIAGGISPFDDRRFVPKPPSCVAFVLSSVNVREVLDNIRRAVEVEAATRHVFVSSFSATSTVENAIVEALGKGAGLLLLAIDAEGTKPGSKMRFYTEKAIQFAIKSGVGLALLVESWEVLGEAGCLDDQRVRRNVRILMGPDDPDVARITRHFSQVRREHVFGISTRPADIAAAMCELGRKR